MRRLLTVLAAAVTLAAAVYLPTASAQPQSTDSTAQQCRSVSVKAPAGTKAETVTAVAHAAGTVDVPPVTPLPEQHIPDVPAFCDLTVTLTHPGQGDRAKVRVWLPLNTWNGRLQTIGGQAYAAGDYGGGLAAAVKNGYAAATTDAGVSTYIDTSWALNSKNQVDTTLLKNFASRSEHEAAVVAKEVIDGFYGKPASYAYFNGCSTGGRQGYMEAQRHPDDYDGILANAPAINWDEFEVATLWPQVVMNNEKTYPTDCEFAAFTNAAVKACDSLDGVKDGLVDDPQRCDFDPRRLIGTEVACKGQELTITASDAVVVRKIWDGPRAASGKQLWSGVPVGADLSALAGITPPDADGNVAGAPFPVPAAWVTQWVAKDPSLDLSKITYSRFTRLFQQSEAEYDKVIGTDDPDLSAFRNSGGRLLTWHGQADQYIPTQGTVQYRQQVERKLGGAQRVDDFYRLFLAPGTPHCGLNQGHGTTDDLGALTAWVEHGKAPETLPATLINADGRQVTRNLCSYPSISHYTGQGDAHAGSGFRCVFPSRH
ncbi:tannase/feruloyl esterase family alpha/beta hydrolase [Streptomyces sp. NPDC050523]|uniref:tannase/feruloyl esterase family alpha/beta hydrolase n=1 Tax=Streptomyces sp. NPDC050523 TaxID=3365622 RepID=UPI0037B2F2C1